MNKEFKTIKGSSHTRYVLETTTAGATGSAAIATAEKPLGELQKRQSVSVPVTQKPRQGPLRQQTGAGQHRDKKKEQKSGKEKHRKPFAESFDSEYDDEAGMAQSNLLTTARAVMGLLKTIKARDNLPEWGQEKIAKAEMMLVSVWDYLQSQKEMGRDPQQDVGEGLRDPKDNPCWKGYKPVGTKQKGGRTVPNCVPKEGVDVDESGLQYYTGVKKHGKEYMVKAAQAARKGASQAELGALKDKYSKAYKEDNSSDDNPQHSHQYKTTMKHADRPTVQQRMAAHDIKPGVAGYRDRIDLLKDLERTGKLKEGLRPEEQEVIDQLIDGDLDAYDVMTRPQGPAQEKVSMIIQDKYENVSVDHRLHPDDDFERILDIVLDQIADDYGHSGDMEEAAPKGWEGTVKAMKKHKEIDNPYALAHYMKNKGYKSHKEDAYMESLFKALEIQSKK